MWGYLLVALKCMNSAIIQIAKTFYLIIIVLEKKTMCEKLIYLYFSERTAFDCVQRLEKFPNCYPIVSVQKFLNCFLTERIQIPNCYPIGSIQNFPECYPIGSIHKFRNCFLIERIQIPNFFPIVRIHKNANKIQV